MASSSSKGHGSSQSKSERVWPFFRKRSNAEVSIRDLLKEEHGDLLKEFEKLLESRKTSDSPAASIFSDPLQVYDSVSTQPSFKTVVPEQDNETPASRQPNYCSVSTQTDLDEATVPENREDAVWDPVYTSDDLESSEQNLVEENIPKHKSKYQELSEQQPPPQLILTEIRPFEELNSTSTAPTQPDTNHGPFQLQLIPVQPFKELNSIASIDFQTRDESPQLQLIRAIPFEELNSITSAPPQGFRSIQQRRTPEKTPDRNSPEPPDNREVRRRGDRTFVPWGAKWISIRLPKPLPKYPPIKQTTSLNRTDLAGPVEVDRTMLLGMRYTAATKEKMKETDEGSTAKTTPWIDAKQLPEVDHTSFLGMSYNIGAKGNSKTSEEGSTTQTAPSSNAEKLSGVDRASLLGMNYALDTKDKLKEADEGTNTKRVRRINTEKHEHSTSEAGGNDESINEVSNLKSSNSTPKEGVKPDSSPEPSYANSKKPLKFALDPNSTSVGGRKFDFSSKPSNPQPKEPLKFDFSTKPAGSNSNGGLKFDFTLKTSTIPTKEPPVFDFSTKPFSFASKDGLKFDFSTNPPNSKRDDELSFDFNTLPSSSKSDEKPIFDFSRKPSDSKPTEDTQPDLDKKP